MYLEDILKEIVQKTDTQDEDAMAESINQMIKKSFKNIEENLHGVDTNNPQNYLANFRRVNNAWNKVRENHPFHRFFIKDAFKTFVLSKKEFEMLKW